jgi:hypothetical protein
MRSRLFHASGNALYRINSTLCDQQEAVDAVCAAPAKSHRPGYRLHNLPERSSPAPLVSALEASQSLAYCLV